MEPASQFVFWGLSIWFSHFDTYFFLKIRMLDRFVNISVLILREVDVRNSRVLILNKIQSLSYPPPIRTHCYP